MLPGQFSSLIHFPFSPSLSLTYPSLHTHPGGMHWSVHTWGLGLAQVGGQALVQLLKIALGSPLQPEYKYFILKQRSMAKTW